MLYGLHYHVRVSWRSSFRRVPLEVILDKDYFSDYSSLLSVLYEWMDFFYLKALEYNGNSGKIILTVEDLDSHDIITYSILTDKVS